LNWECVEIRKWIKNKSWGSPQKTR
jgi:hypothetical protein